MYGDVGVTGPTWGSDSAMGIEATPIIVAITWFLHFLFLRYFIATRAYPVCLWISLNTSNLFSSGSGRATAQSLETSTIPARGKLVGAKCKLPKPSRSQRDIQSYFQTNNQTNSQQMNITTAAQPQPKPPLKPRPNPNPRTTKQPKVVGGQGKKGTGTGGKTAGKGTDAGNANSYFVTQVNLQHAQNAWHTLSTHLINKKNPIVIATEPYFNPDKTMPVVANNLVSFYSSIIKSMGCLA